MSVRAAKSRLLLSALCITAVIFTGCGGAAARKARHLEKGKEFYSAGNFEKARVEFRNALQIAPNDGEARYQNGLVDERLGNPREAAQFYQGAIDSNKDDVAARAALGRLYLFSGAPEKALESIKPSLVAHPDDPALLTVRAAAKVQLKDIDGALLDAEEAANLAPSNEDAIAVLAGVYKAQNNPEKAEVLLENSIKQIPGTVDLRLALAQLYSSLGKEPQVEALLIELTRLKPKDKSDRLRLAQYYTRLNHPDEAEQTLRQAIKDLPEERDLKIALVDFLAAHRSREVAAKELGVMIAANPKDYDLKLAQAAFYEQSKQPDQAEKVYQRVITDSDPAPPATTARDRLAALKIRANDVPAAQRLLAEVLKKNPRDNDALIMRGNISLAEKDPKSAIVDLRAVLRDQPNAAGVMRNLARAHLANNEPALAEETMRRAVDVNPKDAGAQLDLAQLLLQMGQAGKAKPVIEELVKEQPNNISALDTQFRVAAATNDISGAKAAADAIVALQPQSALGYFYRGLAAESLNHMDDAVTAYSLALDKQPEAQEPLQALALLLVKLNRVPEAMKRLDDLAAKAPSLPFALNIKGELLTGLHRPAEAETAFKTAMERAPKWWPPYRGLALAQAARQDIPGQTATLLDGISKVTQPESLQIDLARVYEIQGKTDAAIQLYQDALHKNPDLDVAANNLAMMLVTYKTDRASLDQAKELSQRFSSSTNAAFLDTYGWVLYKRGEAAAAEPVLQSALSKVPDSPVSLYHLGMAQASAGHAGAARDSLERSLKSGKPFSGMDEAKATLDKLAKFTPSNPASKS